MTRTEEEAASAIAVVAAMVAWASMVAWAQGLCLGGARSRMRLAQALALYCGPGHRVSLDGAVALLRWFDVFAVFASENLPSLLNSPLQCVCACWAQTNMKLNTLNAFLNKNSGLKGEIFFAPCRSN